MLKRLSKKIGLFNYHAALGQKKDRRWHPENFSEGLPLPLAPLAWPPPPAEEVTLVREGREIQEPTVPVNSRAVERARSWSESRSWLRWPRRQSPSTGCPCRHA